MEKVGEIHFKIDEEAGLVGLFRNGDFLFAMDYGMFSHFLKIAQTVQKDFTKCTMAKELAKRDNHATEGE